MYNCSKCNLQSIKDLTISTLELSIAQECNMACKYCYLHGKTENISPFNRWKELLDMLMNINISNGLTIGLATGELFLDSTVGYVYNAVKKLNKINRFSDTNISYRLYSNGSSAKNIIDVFDYIGKYNTMISISYDGKDSYRKFKRDTIDIEQQLSILSKSDYRDNIIIRYGIFDNVENMFDTFKYIYSLGFKNIEYYMMNTYDEYRSEDLIKTFSNQLYKVLNHFNGSDFNIYNVNKFHNCKEPQRTCSYGKTLAVGINGELSMCSTSFEGEFLDELSIDLSDYEKLPELYNKFESMYIEPRETMDCSECNNFLCEECCSFKAIGGRNNYNTRKYQQCDIRHAELEVYNRVLR